MLLLLENLAKMNLSLDKIDVEFLGRNADDYMPDMWFSQPNSSITKQHSVKRNIAELRLGSRVERLKRNIKRPIISRRFPQELVFLNPVFEKTNMLN